MTIRLIQDRDSIGSFKSPLEALTFVERMDPALLDSVHMVASEFGAPLAALPGAEAAEWLQHHESPVLALAA